MAYATIARFRWRLDTGALMIGSLSSSYVNAGNLGFAIAAYVVGDITVVVPTLLVQMLLVQPLALIILDRHTGRGKGPATVLRRMVTNPLTSLPLSGWLRSLSPGGRLPARSRHPCSSWPAPRSPSCSCRTAPRCGSAHRPAGPATTVRWSPWWCSSSPSCRSLPGWSRPPGLGGTALLGVVLTAALPTAQNIFLHATRYRVGEDVARETILLTTLCSLPVALLVAALLG